MMTRCAHRNTDWPLHVALLSAATACLSSFAEPLAWEGSTNLTMTANTEVEVADGTTNLIGTLAGSYTLTKTGGGTLVIRRVTGTGTKITVSEGDVRMDNPAPEALRDAYFHVDASVADSLVLAQENGTNFVTRWNDCGGGPHYATNCKTVWTSASGAVLRPDPESRRPYLSVDSTSGRHVVDFGSLLTQCNTNSAGGPLGYGAALSFDQRTPSIVEGFTVAADDDDIPKWPSVEPNYVTMVPQSLFSCEDTVTCPRGNYNTSGHNPGCLIRDAGHSLSVYPDNSGCIWINGTVLAKYAKWALLAAGLNVVRIRPEPSAAAAYPNHVRFGSFAASRANDGGTTRSYGGQRIAEYAVFTNSLDDAVAEDIDLYLRLKWYTKQTIASVTVADGASFRTGENVIVAVTKYVANDNSNVEIPYGNSVSVDTLLSANTVLHLDASKTNTMVFTTDNGTNFVTRWNDCAGGSLYATHDATSSTLRDDPDNRKPFFGPVKLNGLPVMDFGSAILAPVTNSAGRGLGYGAAMNLSAAQAYLAEAISVVSDTEDLKTLKSGDGKKDGMFGPAFFAAYGHSSTYGARGKTINGKNPAYFASDKGAGTMYLDGSEVPTPSNWPKTSYPDGFHVLDYICPAATKYTRVDYLARNNQENYNSNTYGGQRIAEYMLFKTAMGAEERVRVQKALRAKWFGDARETRRYAALRVPAGASFSVVYENIAISDRLVIGGKVAAASVDAGRVEVSDSAVVEGALALSDGATLAFGCGVDGIASLAAGSVAAASGSGTVVIATGGLSPRSMRGVSVRLVSSASVDAKIASWNVVCDMSGVRLRLADDGLYADFPKRGFVLIVE